jgi:signal transduction histidine kinase
VFGIAVALLIGGEVFALLNVSSDVSHDFGTTWGRVAWGLGMSTFPVVGVLIASRRPDHAVAWACLGVGFFFGIYSFASSYSAYVVETNPDSLPGGTLMTWLAGATYPFWLGLLAIYLPLVFPDGRLPSPRWRALPWITAIGILGLSASEAFTPGPLEESRAVENPFGIERAEGLLKSLEASKLLLLAALVCAVVSVVLRYRRATGEERLQLKWFATAAAFATVVYLPANVLDETGPTELARPFEDASITSAAAFAIAVGVAVLKYRLYDIEVVINKALIFGALAAFVAAVYVAIVVGLGAAVGTVGEPNIVLSILATAVIALAFQPARERAERLANRLVYGKRATPYEVLAEFSERVAETYATEDVLPKMARTVAEGTGAERAGVWLRTGDELRLAASWPPADDGHPQPIGLSNGDLPSFPSVDRAVGVRHQNELLGALTVVKPAGEALTPTEDKLLGDLAAQAGLVLRNVGLTSELLARLDELAASRQRLVSAQDEERRRLERNLHDGAQQHLVALKVKINLASRLVKDDPRVSEALGALEGIAEEAIEALRDLARGIYPPLLADQGLATALRAQARKAALPVDVEAEELSRYPQDVEAAVYFCCLEALQNVAKYAGATEAIVRLHEEDGRLRFSVTDDGAGFDPASTPKGSGLQNMADRLEALGGRFEMRSAPGEGTTVLGEVPATPTAPSGEAGSTSERAATQRA